MTQHPSGHPELDALLQGAQRPGLLTVALPCDPELRNQSLGLVGITFGAQTYRVVVDNEYGDLAHDLAAMRLHLVLSALEDYAECEDFLKWCNLTGLAPSSVLALDLYRDLGEAAHLLEGPLAGLRPISSFEWQLNSGAAQALRGMAPPAPPPPTSGAAEPPAAST